MIATMRNDAEDKVAVQCKSCPWKRGNRNCDIPRYDRDKHEALTSTIAEPGEVSLGAGTINVMACHLSKEGADRICVGWLDQQLGPGNNIALRLYVIRNPSLANYKTVGEQRDSLQETLDETD